VESISPLEQRIAGIAALDQPIRRQLYRLLTTAEAWVTRDDAAAALDVPRSVAAVHLDKLVDAGVVEVRVERISGRQGPGAGASRALRPTVEPSPSRRPARKAWFMPQTRSRCSSARRWKGQLASAISLPRPTSGS
jgi:DNA-binding transcriptional ArsR family regulator